MEALKASLAQKAAEAPAEKDRKPASSRSRGKATGTEGR